MTSPTDTSSSIDLWPEDGITELEDSLLNRVRHESDRGWQRPFRFRLLEIDNNPDVATNPGLETLRPEDITSDQLAERLNQIRKTIFRPLDPNAVKPKLRLLIYQWNDDPHLPFLSTGMARKIIESLNLPPSFPYYHELKSIQSVISFSRAKKVVDKVGFSHLFLKTQLYRPDHAYSLALGYNTESDSVSGLLCLSQKHDHLIGQICALHKFADHPLLLPLIIFQDLIKLADEQWSDSSWQLNCIERMNIKKDKLTTDGKNGNNANSIGTDNLEEIAQTMAQLQENLESGKFDPLLSLVDDLDPIFTRAESVAIERQNRRQPQYRQNDGNGGSVDNESVTLELCEQYRAARQAARAIVRRKESIERGLQFQATLLYSNVARRDTAIALRDSAQMKAIAMLTMFYLPTTALAAVFSMSPFFTTDTVTGHVSVNADFWLFFAVTMPITLAVLTGYFAWIQRAEVKRLWKNRQTVENRIITAMPTTKTAWIRGLMPRRGTRDTGAAGDDAIPLQSL